METVGEPGSYANPVVSPNGQRVAFRLTDAQGNRDIWVRDIARGSNTKLTFDQGPDDSPVWSPDSTKIIFTANRGRNMDLYEKNADGNGEERLLLHSDQDKVPNSWSRDARFLLYTSNDPKTLGNLWVLPLEGEPKPFLFLGTEAHETLGQFSPDQRWIAYYAATSGNVEIFVRPFSADSRSAAGAAGARWMISTSGGVLPRWSADGKRLFYLALNGDLMAVDVQAGASFQSGAPQRLFGSVNLAAWSPGPSGDRFLFSRLSVGAGPPPPFTIVLNWMAKLEQQ